MKYALLLLIISLTAENIAQTVNIESDSITENKKSFYREDQFYAGISFNLLTKLNNDVNQSGFSGSFDLGFIRDFPLNKNSTLALGLGAGININTYNQNVFFGETSSGNDIITVLNTSVDYSTNKFSTHVLEFPIQLRWRTSTSEDYAFWRIYAGAKIGYVYYFKSTFEQENNTVIQTDLNALNRFRTSAFLSFGYNIVNIQIQYDLNPLFDGRFSDSESKIGINPLRLGFIFYIL
ncbi:porin family protein [Psychroflexus sp. ALD_RP9]|uniref:porin family protein n=1 Tax=Psychroflexus sp. ALD_RP9 TaxID=2777186 RepID=UPI001A8CC860|nr:porin family protein [Psychroflexus sp. ALD_RP9]QSS97781.1 PorT family protein [Psychroflexus sp. ALD_RP9]